MAELSRFVIDWWLRCAVAGGVLLLVGYLVISLTRQPAKKLAAGFWTLVIALLLPPLTLLPGWLALPWQSPFAAPQRQVVKQEVKRDIATVMTPQRSSSAASRSSSSYSSTELSLSFRSTASLPLILHIVLCLQCKLVVVMRVL
jgi:hypothetical protein